MNVRVSAIILVAAIFMAVWDADQKGIAKDRQRIAQCEPQRLLLLQQMSAKPHVPPLPWPHQFIPRQQR